MNEITLKNNYFDKWSFSYDPFSDVLQVYNEDIFCMPKNSLKEKRERGVVSLSTKNDSTLVLIQVDKAYNKLGIDISKLKKQDVIKLIKPLLKGINHE